MTAREWVEVAALRDLARRGRTLVTVGDERIGLFMIDGTVYALRDVCVHKQRSLTKGTILRGRVICPGHQWAFDPATGRADGQDRCQPTYEVRVEDGAVFVDPRPRTLAAEENR